jgi:hypothetical protein
MVCRNCKMELPVYAKYCPSCGMQVHKPHVHHEMSATKNPQEEAHARHVDWLFEPVYREVELRMEDPQVDKPELYDILHRIESEALKGAQANPDKIKRWLTTIETVAPDVLMPTTSVLLKPDAEVSSAVRKVAEGFAAEAVH